jgi:flagellar basal body rod protein FlgG
MSYGLYISSEGAHSQEYKLRVIANNLANMETSGFKRDFSIQKSRNTEAIKLGEDYPGSGTINDIGGGVITAGTRSEFTQGPMKNTGLKSDVAITGPGWFVMQNTESGENFLTRSGNFQLLNDGSLVTYSGPTKYALCDENLTPMRINPTDPNWQFTKEGALLQGETRQNLALVTPNDTTQMVKVGENMFRSEAGYTPLAPGERNVQSGFLEASNVNPAGEMVDMIVTSRAVETNIKMIQTQDELTNGLLSRAMRVA